MAFASYASRVAAHDTRTGNRRDRNGIRLLVIHTSEGGESTNSAEGLAGFISSPASGGNVASYHDIFDTDRVIPIVPDDWVAYAAAGANHDGLHACYPGKAGQTIDQWHDENSAAMHEQCARWLADKSVEYDIPLRRLSVAEVKAGERGVCGHNEVSLAFKRSTHTDPGPSYPWNYVLGRARELLEPPAVGGDSSTPPPVLPTLGDDDVITSFIKHPDRAGIFAVHSGGYKTLVKDIPTLRLMQGINTLSDNADGNDENLNAEPVLFWATGPVLDWLGRDPERGYDRWGAPA